MCRHVGKTGMGCVSLSDFSASGLEFSWRGLSLFCSAWKKGRCAPVRRFKVEGSRFHSEPAISTRSYPATHGHTTSVLVFGGDEGKTVRRLSIQPRAFFSREVKVGRNCGVRQGRSRGVFHCGGFGGMQRRRCRRVTVLRGRGRIGGYCWLGAGLGGADMRRWRRGGWSKGSNRRSWWWFRRCTSDRPGRGE